MPRNRTPWVVATLMAFIASLLSMSSLAPASAAPGDPIIPLTPSCVVQLASGDVASAPPAPTCYDPSGADLDEFLVPDLMDASGQRVIYGDGAWNRYAWDQPNPTSGAAQVTVYAEQRDPVNMTYAVTHSWTLSFDTSVTAQPAPNAYWVTVGPCLNTQSAASVREVTAFGRNELSSDGRYVRSLYPQASADGVVVAATVPASRVYDGATAAIPLIIDSYTPGLTPGYTYTVKFWQSDTGVAWSGPRVLMATTSVYVPECGAGTGGTPSTVKPRAKISKLSCGPIYCKVKVVLGSRKATAPTKYTVTRDPRVGKPISRSYKKTFKVLKYPKVRKGTVIKVKIRKKSVLAKRRI